MSSKPVVTDPVDGLIVDEVGAWASEKHERLRKYIDAYRSARALFLPPKGTGGAGYIGGHTVIALLDRREIPVVLDDLSTGNREAVPSDVPLVVGDVGDVELVTQIIREHRIDAILHFAAKIVVSESVADPLSYYLNNTVKTHALLEAAVRGNVRHFVFSSTAALCWKTSVDRFARQRTNLRTPSLQRIQPHKRPRGLMQPLMAISSHSLTNQFPPSTVRRVRRSIFVSSGAPSV